MPPIGKGRPFWPFYSHLYHGHRANLLLNRDSHPEIQEGKRERHMVSDCCSCCCAPGQMGSECQCFEYYCYDSEQVTAPSDHQGYPRAARETSNSCHREKTAHTVHKQCQPVALISKGSKKNKHGVFERTESGTRK